MDAHRFRHLILLILILAPVAIYAPVAGHNFVFLDDFHYVVNNPHVNTGLTQENVRWAITATEAANWHPLTWWSHQIDVELFGLRPGPHHLVNLALHVFNTVLLFLVLNGMTGLQWPAAFASLLFAIHPLHVESVAWIAERKDLLSTLFGFLALGAYMRYARSPSARRYLAVAGLLALGLTAKPMLVTLPCLLLLLDFWPLGRMGKGWGAIPRLVLEKIPLLLLSVASSTMTIAAQNVAGSVRNFQDYPLDLRVGNALVALCTYISKTIWPVRLAAFYPHPGETLPGSQVIVCGIALAAMTALVIVVRRSRPELFVGWFWFCGMMVPVLGIVQVGDQAMADRYTYFPLVGLFLVLSFGIPSLFRRRGRVMFPVAAVAVAVVLSIVAFRQVGFWRDSVSLFEHAIEVTPGGNWLAHNNLGTVLLEQGRPDEALNHYMEAMRLAPQSLEVYENLRTFMSRERGRYPEGYSALGYFYVRLGMHREALEAYREAVRLLPNYAEARYNLGVSCLEVGDLTGAREAYERLRLQDPGYAQRLQRLISEYTSH